ncbi:MAG: Wax ester synthase/acyl-CoA:diacylglycerol acyltransferase; Diacyglycerol O-acyltransferase [uncultured Nocardioidaceae bacterium]|uniref:Diacylglycerol O-acyltransferase n=1 Tax=uncultured Nocardioidaceae bacterium TaxID=253824 RepID=A0A6J4LYJ1_9ACTN|nr:MAG: Wax ester synthase/acyl-CoA:diacylglycerol acyltransferase; Diacyglycerol O-acyltransferase [uncultured Nocardioidaceae bacterium]
MERLRPGDLALLAMESASTPMHLATVEVFEPPEDGFDYRSLVALVADRLAFVPRYRQRLLQVPGGLAPPVWADDDDFDLTYHVRQSAVPRPGSREQLQELVARIITRPLDRTRPLWEMYLIEGLEGGRFAILSKSHQTLVDGVSTIDLGQVIVDAETVPREEIPDGWVPRPEPSSLTLLADAVHDRLRDPVGTVGAVRNAVGAVGAVARANPLLRSRRTAPESPLQVTLSQQRRFLTVRTELDDYGKIRRFHGGTVNDVVLATVTGALRAWLMTRAESLRTSRHLRAMVPMGVMDKDLEPTSLGSQVAGNIMDLPIGEPSPVVRLHQVSYAMKAHKDTGRAVSALRLIGVGGFAPTTFHALGARVAADAVQRGFHLVVTNVPGPQFPLYAAGARMTESYPVQPLLPGHALAIGVTSYDGGVHFGITADRDAIPDVEVIGQCITEALAELSETTSESRMRAPRGREPGRRRPPES